MVTTFIIKGYKMYPEKGIGIPLDSHLVNFNNELSISIMICSVFMTSKS